MKGSSVSDGLLSFLIFLSDGFRPVRPLPFGNLTPGGVAIIKSRLCREAAKVGGGLWPLVDMKRERIPTGASRPRNDREKTGRTLGRRSVGRTALPARNMMRKRRGDAPQGYLFRFAPLRGHRPLRTSNEGTVVQRLSLRHGEAVTPPSAREARVFRITKSEGRTPRFLLHIFVMHRSSPGGCGPRSC